MNKTIRMAAASAGAAYLLAGLAVPVQANGRAQVFAAKAADAGRDQRTCVRAELPGSRLPRTICRNAAEWEVVGGSPFAAG